MPDSKQEHVAPALFGSGYGAIAATLVILKAWAGLAFIFFAALGLFTKIICETISKREAR